MRSLFFGSEVQPDHAAAFDQLKAAFGEHSDVEKALRRAGEPGLQDKGGWDALLTRYLRAEKYNVQKAEKRLRDQAVWRSAFCPKGQFSEDEFRNELAAQKVFLQGPDKHGRGVIILKTSRHSKTKRDLEETKRCICYTLDHQIRLHDLRLNPDAKGLGIFDLRDITMDCLDFGALHAVFDILQNHYPERLGVMVMFCAPFIFGALWKAVSPFIDPDTKKKIVFVTSSNAKAEIGDIFEPKGVKHGAELLLISMEAAGLVMDLPEFLGGSAPLIPVEDAVAALKANQK